MGNESGFILSKEGYPRLKTGFSAKSGSATVAYTPPKMTASKTGASGLTSNGSIMDYLKNPVVLGGLGLAVFLMLKK